MGAGLGSSRGTGEKTLREPRRGTCPHSAHPSEDYHRRLAAEEGLAGGCCLRSERTLGVCPDSAGNYAMLDHLCCQAQGGMYTAATSVLRNDGRKL